MSHQSVTVTERPGDDYGPLAAIIILLALVIGIGGVLFMRGGGDGTTPVDDYYDTTTTVPTRTLPGVKSRWVIPEEGDFPAVLLSCTAGDTLIIRSAEAWRGGGGSTQAVPNGCEDGVPK